MKWTVIRWAGGTFKVPARVRHDYQDYPKGTVARGNLYRLECAIAALYGQWVRDRIGS